MFLQRKDIIAGRCQLDENMGATSSIETIPRAHTITSHMSHGCDLIVLDEGARSAFMDFYDRGDWLRHFRSNLPEDVNVNSHAEYKLPEGIHLSDFESKLSGVPLTNNIDYFKSGTLLTPVLVAALFPHFLKSKEYAMWVLSGSSKIRVAGRIKQEQFITGAEVSESSQSGPDIVSNSVVNDALKSDEAERLKSEIETGSWLELLVSMIEDLPLCVSIASASEKNKGFPLIYVNKAFEKMSGYDRSEVVNKNCRFLQSASTEVGQIERLSEALRLAKPVKVALTNVRKDGTEFANFLAIKPVFNHEGVYTYVIGVQCDISDPTVSHRTMRVVEDLLSILPNILN